MPSAVAPFSEDVAMSWLSTTPFSGQDLEQQSETGALIVPVVTLRQIGPSDILIVASNSSPGVSDASPTVTSPKMSLPLTLAKADVRSRWEGQVSPDIPEYVIWGTVDGTYLDIRVYFGRQDPSQEMLADANDMLAALTHP